MTPEIWTSLAIAVIGAGGIGTWLRVRADRPRIVAEQHSIVVKDMVELNELLKIELAAAREDALLLRKEITDLRGEVSVLRARLRVLEAESNS